MRTHDAAAVDDLVDERLRKGTPVGGREAGEIRWARRQRFDARAVTASARAMAAGAESAVVLLSGRRGVEAGATSARSGARAEERCERHAAEGHVSVQVIDAW